MPVPHRLLWASRSAACRCVSTLTLDLVDSGFRVAAAQFIGSLTVKSQTHYLNVNCACVFSNCAATYQGRWQKCRLLPSRRCIFAANTSWLSCNAADTTILLVDPHKLVRHSKVLQASQTHYALFDCLHAPTVSAYIVVADKSSKHHVHRYAASRRVSAC